MDTQTHKILDYLEHLWPYISGVIITLFAAIRLAWHTHKQTKQDIADFRFMVSHIRENYVTKDELHACRDDVRQDDEANLEKIYEEIKSNNAENSRQHQDIMKQIIRLHQ